MTRYITYRDNDSTGQLQYYVLQRDFPHYVGIVSVAPVSGAMCCSPIPGYNLFIVFTGVLRGDYIPAYSGVKADIEMVFNDMASWYLEERIKKDEKKYTKFKIK